MPSIQNDLKRIRLSLKKRREDGYTGEKTCTGAYKTHGKIDRGAASAIIKLKGGKVRADSCQKGQADGGPGSGNWGHEGRDTGEPGGSKPGGGKKNRTYRNKIGFIATMKKGDAKLLERTDRKVAKMRKKLPGLMKESHETWESCVAASKSGSSIPSGSEARKDRVLKGLSPGAQKRYDRVFEAEQRITKDLIGIASDSGTEMYGLDFSLKKGSSVVEKVARKRAADIARELKPKTDEEYVSQLGDLVRYTQLCDHNKMADVAKGTLSSLKAKGYDVVEVDNKWQDEKSTYKGFHIIAKDKNGQRFELQIHSKESMDVKELNHVQYEVARQPKASAYVRDTLDPQMAERTAKMKKPKGMNDPALKSWKNE